MEWNGSGFKNKTGCSAGTVSSNVRADSRIWKFMADLAALFPWPVSTLQHSPGLCAGRSTSGISVSLSGQGISTLLRSSLLGTTTLISDDSASAVITGILGKNESGRKNP